MQIRSAECTACLACVAACPAEHAQQFALPARRAQTAGERWRGRVLKPAWVAAAILLLFAGAVGVARLTGHWQTRVPPAVYRELIPQADAIGHAAY